MLVWQSKAVGGVVMTECEENGLGPCCCHCADRSHTRALGAAGTAEPVENNETICNNCFSTSQWHMQVKRNE